MRALLVAALMTACAADDPRVLRVAGSALGAEGEVLAAQLARFGAAHGLRVELVAVPDAADQRHQLYVQWLNAGAATPDVLQIDVVWTAELAAAGWLAPVALEDDDVFPAVRDAARGVAVPLFVDVGMLYYRTDLVPRAPATLRELGELAARSPLRYGLVLQAARYEGLITGFLEILTGMGGELGELDGPAARRALTFLRQVTPREALAWHEEESRRAFQDGEALFMRNWPYAYPLMQDPARSRVAGRFAVAPMPADEGRPAATLGGAMLAVNARSRLPGEARELLAFLSAREQQLERARVAGQYPPRPSLYAGGALDGVLPVPPSQALAVLEHAVARPVTPRYAELSAAWQVPLHAALSGQLSVDEALARAQRSAEAVAAAATPPPASPLGYALVGGAGGVVLLIVAVRRFRAARAHPGEEGLAWLLVAPAGLIVLVMAVLPLGFTVWESLHQHDLRAPADGRPFVGLHHYVALLGEPRFLAALGHTLLFAVVSVTLELVLGTALALFLHRLVRGRDLLRTVVLLPWAIPTVVAALLWRFLFTDVGGELLFVDATLAWIPIVLADVWKTVPFVTLLVLAGLAGIDDDLYEAARVDGASRWQQLTQITLPLLVPTFLVILVFRSLDALRVFDVIYVMTGGGPGTATEPLSLLAHSTLLGELRFGRGAAISVVVFAIAFVLAVIYARLLREEP